MLMIFLIAGDLKNPKWQAIKQKLVNLYTWGKWETHKFKLCGIDYEQRTDYSVKMARATYAQSLKTAE